VDTKTAGVEDPLTYYFLCDLGLLCGPPQSRETRDHRRAWSWTGHGENAEKKEFHQSTKSKGAHYDVPTANIHDWLAKEAEK